MWKRKPPGDIAQAVIGLMEDASRWKPGLLCVRHTQSDLVVRNDWCTAVVIGEARMRFEGRDQRAVDKAYRKLKKRLAEGRQQDAAQRVRDALALPADPSEPAPVFTESIEAVEARVRRLREAVLQAS